MKLFIGPVSKNTIDVVISLANEGYKLGLIPSRRQVDYDNGYVYNTFSFVEYVRSKTNNIIIERDHGGRNQGETIDDGYQSYEIDCELFDMIHVDPWKATKNYQKGLKETIENIEFCFDKNHKLLFEIGTEESIRYFSTEELGDFVSDVKSCLTKEVRKSIEYVIVQSGTKLLMEKNVGIFDKKRLSQMVEVAKKHKLLSKIHNGDYLSIHLIKEHYDLGVDAINIAPEFGNMESSIYIKMLDHDNFNKFYQLCYESKQWVKWVNETFNSKKEKEKLVKICGHYLFSTPEFQKLKIELEQTWNIDNIIKNQLKKKIGKILNV